MAGLYLHIPFCASRCIYCGFYSTTQSDQRNRYVDALIRELHLRQEECVRLGPIQTIYLGGGTPSQLSAAQLHRLFAAIDTTVHPQWERTEVTLEANPDDITTTYASELAHLPINRVSLGAQTFDDNRLQFLHRRHRAAQVQEAIERLRAVGIQNISIDLMFGFPSETLDEWQQDVQQAILLAPDHISAYALSYEEGTLLYRLLQEQQVQPVDEELSRAMYYLMKDHLEAAGYEHYEISNFARKRSLHNSSYWQSIPYIGLGAAAHSFSGDTRSWNVSNLQQYLSSIEAGQRPFEQETIDADTHYNDLVVTALRTREGIPFDALTTQQRDYLLQQAAPMVERGLLSVDADRLHLTREGLFISDNIMMNVMM